MTEDEERRIVARLAALAKQWSPHDHGASWIDAQLSRVPENDSAAVEAIPLSAVSMRRRDDE